MERVAFGFGEAADGTGVYLVDWPVCELPPVRSGDLLAAWDAARAGAQAGRYGGGGPWGFRFRQADGSVTDLALRDRDAACWAAAIARAQGGMEALRTPYGLSVCLRFLALVDLLAREGWARALCTVRRHGAELHPALLRMAATAELTNDARFDETRFRAGLDGLAGPQAGAIA